jgi:hypothetical protein
MWGVAAVLAAAPPARGQTRWSVDQRASLAWWQVNPHLNHLWATTCPEEPSWRPGEGRTIAWENLSAYDIPKQGYAGVSDTTQVPLYPRPRARSVCTEAVSGQVVAADTVTWQGVRGEIAVLMEALITGHERRDQFARLSILEVDRYPEARFKIDSLVGVTRQADTIHGTAVGFLTIRYMREPMKAAVRAWPEAGGLRVLAKFRMPASALVEEYGLSRFSLGLGVMTRIWYDLFMGVDLVLRPVRTRGN